jgi:16S rRNA (guanine966-N2)-methyltransferase
VRVIAGTAKGRKLKFPNLPKGKRLRPLTGQAKEALFNILAGRIEGAKFLDLFAGTGSVGIEALSRGAELAFFVESDRKVVTTLRENLELTGFADRSEVFCLDVLKALSVFERDGGKFDIIFIGAPYGDPALEKTLKGLSAISIVGDRGVVIAEHSARDKVQESYGSMKKFRDARYGDTVLSFYSAGDIE